MANYIHLTGNNNPIPPNSLIYRKPTNNVGGWSYAARPDAEDSKFYELNGMWFYVVEDSVELASLIGFISNGIISIIDKDGITKSIPVNNIVTTRVNDMNGMFQDNSSFNSPIGNWDVSNVVNMKNMFHSSSRYGTPFHQPIGNWDTGNVVTMEGMFAGAIFNMDIGNWDVQNVTTMKNMFAANERFNKPIGNWNVHNVTDMSGMFSGIGLGFNQDIGNWAVHNVTNMAGMFNQNMYFNQDLSSWCVSSVTNHANFDTNTIQWTLPKPNFNNPPC